MADPKVALAGIGKYNVRRIGPAPKIQAIQKDMIRVNFDPSRTSARLTRMAPTKKANSSMIVSSPKTSRLDISALEAEAKEDMKKLESPSRRLSLVSRASGTSVMGSLASSRKSSLALASARRSSFDSSAGTSSTSSLRSGLELAVARKSSLGIPGERKRLGKRATRNGLPERHPHGFRYHSNGDERLSRSTSFSSSTVAGGADAAVANAGWRMEEATKSFAELCRMRAKWMYKPPRMRRLPPSKMAARYLTAEAVAAAEEKRMLQEEATPGLFKRRLSEGTIPVHRRNSGTRGTNEGDNMFKQTILRHIRDMAQSGETPPGRSLTRVHSAASASNTAVTMSRLTGSSVDPSGLGKSRHGLASPQQYLGENGGVMHGFGITASSSPPERVQFECDASLGDCFSAGNSSFNMRFGVPVKMMAQRKHILDEQHYRELEESYKNDAQISDFLHGIRNLKLHSETL